MVNFFTYFSHKRPYKQKYHTSFTFSTIVFKNTGFYWGNPLNPQKTRQSLIQLADRWKKTDKKQG